MPKSVHSGGEDLTPFLPKSVHSGGPNPFYWGKIYTHHRPTRRPLTPRQGKDQFVPIGGGGGGVGGEGEGVGVGVGGGVGVTRTLMGSGKWVRALKPNNMNPKPKQIR